MKNIGNDIKKRTENSPFFAESEGFEPPVRRNAYTAFRVRLFRPLRQLSFTCGCKSTAIFLTVQKNSGFLAYTKLFHSNRKAKTGLHGG